MHRCIDLARNGKGSVAPNPMVGSVVVFNDKVIGEGYHKVYGGPHAEVNAINSVKNQNLLPKSTLYVSLEPCSHTGKTPPCSDLIIDKKIKKVVIGSVDPNSLVAGRGIEKLKQAGIEVVSDILIDECNELNKRFFTFHRYKRPYIILKWAQSNDGFLDIIRKPGTPIGPNWISNSVSRILVHKWRSVEQSIIVGTNTILQDNPELNTRLWPGKQPLRLVLDRTNRLPETAKVFNSKINTLVFTEKPMPSKTNIEYIYIDFSKNSIQQILDELYKREKISLIVEGGRKLLQSFIEQDLWDEARIFVGNKDFKEGIKAPILNAPSKLIKKILDDTLIIQTKYN